MNTRHSMSEIRERLEREISGALREPLYTVKVEILKIDSSNQGHSVSGSFKVVPFFVTKSGSFEITLNENLEIISFNLKEE